MSAAQLDEAINAVCPIYGVSIFSKVDKTTWRIDFKDEATKAQRSAASVVLDAFDINTPDSQPSLSDGELADLLVAKGIITDADVSAAITTVQVSKQQTALG